MNTFLGATGITAGDSVALLAPPTLAASDPEQAPTPDDSLRHSTIAHYLDAAAIPYVSADLISRDAISHIRRIGALLPGALTDFFGFECPLGTHEAKADFLICSRASEGGRDVLAGQRPSRELPAFLERHPVWQRVRDFSRDWSDSQSPLFEAIHNLWVEFDVDGMPPAIPVPSVFVGSEALRPTEAAADPGLMPRHCAWLLDRALPLLIGRDVDGPTRCQVARCLNLLPAEARIFQVGLMLARASRITRLCVRGVSSKQIPEYLQALGWEGSFPELEGLLKSLAPLVERIDLDNRIGMLPGHDCAGPAVPGSPGFVRAFHGGESGSPPAVERHGAPARDPRCVASRFAIVIRFPRWQSPQHLSPLAAPHQGRV